MYSSFGDKLTIDRGSGFTELCNSEEYTKVKEFQDFLLANGAIFSWELNVDFEDRIFPLKFSGGKSGEQFFIFGLETNSDIPFLYEELMKINNEQANQVRELVRESYKANTQIQDHNEIYDELSKLNNELANLQRELSRKNAELSHLNELKNQFLGMAAHDLRNPLSNILFYMQFILDDGENLSEEQLDFSKQVILLAKFMLGLVNDLLDVSVIEKGKINLHLSECSVTQIISETLKLNKVLGDKKNIKTEISVPEHDVLVRVDKEKIKQVIINLYTNAVKYSEEDTKIMIRLEQEEKELVISVEDQGQGIDKNELDLLFKPFQKTSSVTTGGEKSTGLGLYIAKKIVNAHQGEIRATSMPGKGSVFSFTLPLN